MIEYEALSILAAFAIVVIVSEVKSVFTNKNHKKGGKKK